MAGATQQRATHPSRTACTTQHPALHLTYTLQAPRSVLSHTCQGILNWDPILEPLSPVSLSSCNPIRTSPLLAQKTIYITFVTIGAHLDITFVGTRTDPLVLRAGRLAGGIGGRIGVLRPQRDIAYVTGLSSRGGCGRI
jgi:hypothetical protein